MFSFSSNKSNWCIAYYLMLLVAMFFLMQPFTTPPMMTRLIFFGFVFLPTIMMPRILPAVLLLFYGIDKSSFTHVLPETDMYIFIMVLVCYVLYKEKSLFLLRALGGVLYFFICALIHYYVSDFFSWILVAILLSDMIKNKDDLNLLFHAYLAISLFLGLLFLVHQQVFAIQYGRAVDDLERSGWINNNVFGGAIAAGGVFAIAYLTGVFRFAKNRITTLLSITTIIIVFIVLTLNASRGAFIGFLLAATLFFITSNSKLYVKLLIIIVAGIVCYLMYTKDTFALLQIRMESDNTATMGGRSLIWKSKLQAFFSIPDFWKLLFGIGQLECVKIGVYYSTHNDFVTSIIAYGFIGFIIFLYILIYPIKKSGKKKWHSIFLLLYLFVECFVLEPIFRGYLIEIVFYFFVLKYALINDTEPA